MPENEPLSFRRSRRDILLFSIATLVFIITLIAGGMIGHPGKFFLEVFHLKIPAGRFIILYSGSWFLMILLFFFFPGNLSRKQGIMIILVLSVISRMALFYHEPSDDVNRYLWEGAVVAADKNPYFTAPNDQSLVDMAAEFPLHSAINHPDIPAAYPPMMLWLFSVSGKVSQSPALIKIVMILFDIGAVIFLIMVLQERRVDIRWSLLYAVNPLILYSFAGQAHFDSIQNCFLLAAIWLFDRQKWGLMFIAAGIAVQVKYVAILSVPFFINRSNLRYSYLILFPIILPYLPFAVSDTGSLFNGILRFGDSFAFNGLIHGMLRLATGGIEPATRICKIAFAGMMIIALIRYHPAGKRPWPDDPVSGIAVVMGTLLLLSPTVHFWYISWILPFAVIRNMRSWIVLTLFASFYFVASGIMHHTGEWQLPVWAQIFEWAPFVVFFSVENRYVFKRYRNRIPKVRVKTVTVIIPAYNEEPVIETCIRNVMRDSAVSEIIVVDGGSDDSTRVRAANSGASVIEHKALPENGGGRGGQIVRGIEAASGDVVAVVHADIKCEQPVFTEMVRILNKNPDIAGGAVGSVFDEISIRMKTIELLNSIRSVFFGISFGDQIQFFRRSPVVNGGLFPPIPLMEDVEFSYRLPEAGRSVFLFGEPVVSSRRWKSSGFVNFLTVIRFFSRYVLQRLWKMPDAAAMYYSYYSSKHQNRG